MMEPLSGNITIALVDQYMIFTPPLNVGHPHIPCMFSVDPQATQLFLLVEIP